MYRSGQTRGDDATIARDVVFVVRVLRAFCCCLYSPSRRSRILRPSLTAISVSSSLRKRFRSGRSFSTNEGKWTIIVNTLYCKRQVTRDVFSFRPRILAVKEITLSDENTLSVFLSGSLSLILFLSRSLCVCTSTYVKSRDKSRSLEFP